MTEKWWARSKWDNQSLGASKHPNCFWLFCVTELVLRGAPRDVYHPSTFLGKHFSCQYGVPVGHDASPQFGSLQLVGSTKGLGHRTCHLGSLAWYRPPMGCFLFSHCHQQCGLLHSQVTTWLNSFWTVALRPLFDESARGVTAVVTILAVGSSWLD